MFDINVKYTALNEDKVVPKKTLGAFESNKYFSRCNQHFATFNFSFPFTKVFTYYFINLAIQTSIPIIGHYRCNMQPTQDIKRELHSSMDTYK